MLDCEAWFGPTGLGIEEMAAFYDYSEPFSAECRAFGRLKEAGHEELSIDCFGYVLLDEKHELLMMDRFSHLGLDFEGSFEQSWPGSRSHFLGKSGKPPPIRGIVKQLGQIDELQNRSARTILDNITRLQQLGIVYVDVAARNLVGGQFADFSTAVTTPHYITNPELSKSLSPELVAAAELNAFKHSLIDFFDFDEMVKEWNEEQEDSKKVSVFAFPTRYGRRGKHGYNLRPTPERMRLYSFVDPRKYDWRGRGGTNPSGSGGFNPGRKANRRWKLQATPPKWYYNSDYGDTAEVMKGYRGDQLHWTYRDGGFIPWKESGWYFNLERYPP